MTDQAPFTLKGRNPDVLTCIANLSNDEVFTPPEFANRMLDTLAESWAAANGGANIWADSSFTFLDPCTKSGVFLREIATRLIKGLEREFPDLQARVDHILTKQLYGIGITQLTALLARRSLYCSKHATGPHSVAHEAFGDNDAGNVWFERTEHVRDGDRCRVCGAGKAFLDRGPDEENHAYAFIHCDDIKARLGELFGGTMHFDVIIGNPPYQLSDASASASASPIYHKFIEQAMALEPRFLSMVTPSRWFVGGKGLDDFRSKMLADRRLRVMVDFIVDKDAFPNVNVNGGLNYFLWDRDNPGDCTITTVERGGIASDPVSRSLNEFDVFIRRNQATDILRKVRQRNEDTFDARVSSRKPLGLPTNYFGATGKSPSKPVKLHSSGKVTWVSRSEIVPTVGGLMSGKSSSGGRPTAMKITHSPFGISAARSYRVRGEACSETYLVAAVTEDRTEAERVCAYMRTIFFRFLVSLRKITQDNKADVFAFVPDLAMDRMWTDDALCQRYALTDGERDFMRSMIREMTFTG